MTTNTDSNKGWPDPSGQYYAEGFPAYGDDYMNPPTQEVQEDSAPEGSEQQGYEGPAPIL